jgi:hypothetical protein
MPTSIIIKIGDVELNGEFNDTLAGQAAAEALADCGFRGSSR